MYKLIIFILVLNISYSQNQFDIIVSTGENNISGISNPAIEIDDTVYTFIKNDYRYTYGFPTSLVKLSLSGSIYSNSLFLDTLDAFRIFDATKVQNKVVICGIRKIKSDGSRILMYGLLNKLMDTIWMKTIKSINNNPGLYKIIQLANGNFAMVGEDTNIRPTGGAYFTNNNAIFILADSIGNIIKYIHFPKRDTNSLEGLNYVMESSTGDIYCVGQVQVGTLYNRGLVIKLNQDGEFIWRKEIEQSKFGFDKSYCKEVTNGNLLLVGSKYKPFFINDAQVWTCVVEIDSSGHVLFEKTFYSNYDSNNSHCIADAQNNINCTGAVFQKGNNFARGYLIKLSPSGDSIWKREFTHGWKDRDEVFTNIALSEDGGYYLTGYNWVQGDNSSKAWIVKVDSNGCVVAGCNTAVNVEKEVYGSLFHLFPNPVSDQLIIYLNDEDLQERNYMLNCYDQNGRLVLTREISGRKSDIDLDKLTSGMYFYQIGDGRKLIQKGKLVKM